MFNASERHLTGNLLIAWITLVDCTSSLWFGYSQGVWAGIIVAADFKRVFPVTVTNADVLGITSSCYFIGAAVGSLGAIALCDRLGRRRTILLGLLVNATGALLQVLSWHFPQLIVGRVVNGMGIGLTSSVCPILVAECVPARVRGKLVSLGSSCNVTAYCLAGWINYGLNVRYGNDQGGPFAWRFPIAFQLIFPILILPVILLAPESPRWLMLAGRGHDAKRVLARLQGKGVAVDDPRVTNEYRSIQGAIMLEREERVPTWDVVMCRDKTQNLRRLLLSCGTQAMQQLSGINALGYYMPIMFAMTGFSQSESLMITAIIGTIYVVSILTSLMLIDRLGRRRLFMNGALVMGASHFVTAFCLKAAFENESRSRTMGIVTTAMFALYHVAFGTGFGSTPWVYNSEINSLGWRGPVASLATAVNWIFGFMVVQITKVGIENLSWRFYLMFAIFCFAFVPIIWALYPETAHRTLEDMDYQFVKHPGILVCFSHELTQATRPESYVVAEKERVDAAERSHALREAEKDGVSDATPVAVTAEVKA